MKKLINLFNKKSNKKDEFESFNESINKSLYHISNIQQGIDEMIVSTNELLSLKEKEIELYDEMLKILEGVK